jgi:hypothetical protein
MARRLLGGALGAVGAAAEVARHMIWYVSYQLDGTTHEDESARKPRNRTP